MENSVFFDLYPPEEARAMELRAQLLSELREWLKESGLTQSQAAKVMRVDQPRVSDIKNGKLSRFTIDKLVEMTTRVGITAEMTIRRPVPHAA